MSYTRFFRSNNFLYRLSVFLAFITYCASYGIATAKAETIEQTRVLGVADTEAAFSKFDTSLGNLTGVTISIDVFGSNRATVENADPQVPIRGILERVRALDWSIEVTPELSISLGISDPHVSTTLNLPLASRLVESFFIISGSFSETWDYTDGEYRVVDGFESLFEGPGVVTLIANTIQELNFTITEGTPLIDKVFDSNATVTITYEYVPPGLVTKITFRGTITVVRTDTGTGTYSGAKVGDSFSGSFVYGNRANLARSIEINPEATAGGWLFSGGIFGANLTNGMTSVNSSGTNVSINNDFPLDAEGATIASQLLGMPVSSGTPIDVWSVQGEKLSLVFQFGFASLDTSLFSGLDFQVTPPERSDVDVVFFTIEEKDPGDNTIIFSAIGVVDIITFPITDPAATRALIPILLQLLLEE